jgi:hypothetical protein
MASIGTCQRIGTLPFDLGDTQGLARGDRFLVFGGGSGHGFQDKILSIDPETGGCEEIGRLPYASRGHQVVQLADKIYLLGGFDGQTKSDLHRIDLDTGTAERLAPMPGTNSWFAAVSHNEAIHVVGGFAIPEGYLADIWVYNPTTDTWSVTEKALSASPFRQAQVGSNALLSHGERILSFGGADHFDVEKKKANAIAQVGALDTTSGTWTELEPLLLPREGIVADADERYGYLVGGMPEDSEMPSDLIERVDLTTGATGELARLSGPRLTPAVAIVGSRLLVAGGVTQPLFDMTDAIEYCDLSAG